MIRVYLVVFFLLSISVQAQITTEGKEFWLGFMQNESSGDAVELEIYVSSRQTSEVTINAPLGNFNITVTVEPGATAVIPIPTLDFMSLREGKAPMGLNIVSNNFVSVYALNKRQSSADAAVILPVTALGKEYYVTAHMEPPEDIIPSSRESCMLIVAVEDNTDIEVIPSVNTFGGLEKGVSEIIRLNAGEMYQIKSGEDLTGTIVRSVSTNSGDCKKVAVFGGNVFTNVGGCGDARDHLFEQMFPLSTWGKNFLYVPYETRSGGDFIKIIASQGGTEVNISGLGTIGLNAGEYYVNKALVGVRKITSNKPISLAQFSRSRSCDNTPSDPFYILVSPLEQRVQQATFNAFAVEDIDRYFLTLIRLSTSTSSVLLDGNDVSGEFIDFGGAAYASIEIAQGDHSVESEDGVIAFVYGYGDQESFGFSAGVALENLILRIDAFDEFLLDVNEEICIGSEVAFEANYIVAGIDVPDYDLFEWDFGDGTVKVGQQAEHRYTEPGTYNVYMLASDGQGQCNTAELVYKTVIVKGVIIYQMIGPESVCPNTTDIQYSVVGEIGNSYRWEIQGGTITSATTGSEITVNWHGEREDAFIRLIPSNSLGCEGEPIDYPVVINNDLEPALPRTDGFNDEEVCYLDKSRIRYFTPEVSGSSYEWFVEGGTFTNDTNINSNEIFVDWGSSSTGQVWYREFNPTISDCEGISDRLNITILSEILVQPELYHVSCKSETDGRITLSISGGKPGDYTVEWDNGMSGRDISGLGAGIYKATITDAIGCNRIEEYTITEPDELLIDDIEVLPPLCYEQASGGIVISVSGGTRDYVYTVTGNGFNQSSASPEITGLNAGIYNVLVTDANGCSISERDIEVIDPSALTFDMESFIKTPVCPQETNGSAFIEAKGGTPDYQFFWSNDPSSNSQNGLGFGRGYHSVKVVDSNGCERNLTFEITEREPKVFIPNAFSPNKDGVNETFKPVLDCATNYYMQVYNKWGSVVFSTEDPTQGWNGDYLNQPSPEGSYSYMIYFAGRVNEKNFEETYRGSFKLIR